jgi:hypothetical protein
MSKFVEKTTKMTQISKNWIGSYASLNSGLIEDEVTSNLYGRFGMQFK